MGLLASNYLGWATVTPLILLPESNFGQSLIIFCMLSTKLYQLITSTGNLLMLAKMYGPLKLSELEGFEWTKNNDIRVPITQLHITNLS